MIGTNKNLSLESVVDTDDSFNVLIMMTVAQQILLFVEQHKNRELRSVCIRTLLFVKYIFDFNRICNVEVKWVKHLQLYVQNISLYILLS